MQEKKRGLDIPRRNQLQQTIDGIRTVIDIGFPDNPAYAYHEYLTQLKGNATVFRMGFENNSSNILSPQDETVLNQWVMSPSGKVVTGELVDNLTELVAETTNNGLVAHDKRHIVIKDSFSCLRFVVEEGNSLQPYQKFAMVGSLLHDFGRLAEPNAYALAGKELGDEMRVSHSIVSFDFSKRILDEFLEIPEQLRNQVLYGVLTHQDSPVKENKSKPFINQTIPLAIQRADREQLIGPEGDYRRIAFDVGMHNMSLQAHGDEQRKTELSPHFITHPELAYLTEFFLRNLHDNIGTQAQKYADRLKIMTGTFLSLSTGDSLRPYIFAPEIARDNGTPYDPSSLKMKKALSEPVWHAISSGPDDKTKGEMLRKAVEIETRRESPRSNLDAFGKSLLIETVSPVGATATDEELRTLDRKFAELDEEGKKKLSHGLLYLLVMRERLDAEQATQIEKILLSHPLENIEYKMAMMIKKASIYSLKETAR